MKPFKKLIPLIVSCILAYGSIYSQIINNNSNIKVFEDAYIKGLNTDFINKGDGYVDNDGIIELNGGNWINRSVNNVFSNYNELGIVKLSGADEQYINEENHGTVFESLTIANGKKLLQGDYETEVKNKLILRNSGVLNLNLKKIIVSNKYPDAIYADTTSMSYILSEYYDYNYDSKLFGEHNDNVYGELQWNTGDNLGIYYVPFGSQEGILTLRLQLKSQGQPSTGNIIFATYPSNNENYPLPAIVSSLSGLRADDVADRYWKIKANYETKPNAEIKFKFCDKDIDQKSNPGLSAEKLNAIRYNTNTNTWLDRAASGSSSSANKTVYSGGIGGGDFYDWWTLTAKSKLETTDFFTPNGDGHNDYFIPDLSTDETGNTNPTINPVQGIVELEGKIYNRWGKKIYEWSGENWWDGRYNGADCPEGTYFYVITAKGSDGVSYNKKGYVALMRK